MALPTVVLAVTETIRDPLRRRPPRTARAVLLCAVALLIGACVADAADAAASRRTGGAGAAAGASRYPAGATRALLHPRRSQYARPGAGVAPAHAAATHRKRAKRKKHRGPVLHGNPLRALLAYQAMQKGYYIPGSGLYQGEPFSYLWPFSQALAATVSMANIPHTGISFAHELHAEIVGLNNYLDTDNAGAPEGVYTSTLAAFDGTVAPPTGPGGAKYYDDNDWIGIELARLYKLTHSAAALGSAEAIMAFEMAGWQASPELGCPGGIPFSNSIDNTDRNTVTTAPAAELAVQLYRLTANPQYLQFAEMAYAWVRQCLLQPNQLYADHVNRRGIVEPALWSYNQGTMIGAGTLLAQATGNSGYLYQARQTARAALEYFTPERLGAENPFFPSIFFRNLMYLDSVTHDPPGQRPAQAYVDYAWQHLRLSNDLFVAGSPASAQLLVQAAIAQIYALLSSPPSSYF
jgi:glycosyl hydrolase family 76